MTRADPCTGQSRGRIPATQSIRRRAVGSGSEGGRWIRGAQRRWIRSRKTQFGVWLPDQRMSDHQHAIAQPKAHQCVRRTELIPTLPFPGMDELPLHVILGHNLVEVMPKRGDVGGILFRTAPKPSAPVTVLRFAAVPMGKYSLKASFNAGGVSAAIRDNARIDESAPEPGRSRRRKLGESFMCLWRREDRSWSPNPSSDLLRHQLEDFPRVPKGN